ncbi:PrsW family intramembrane metalloprotease [Nostoc sp. FACHB-152]|uniref:PrsW family intramembrane metalloprotease n=1 Tax=unclassified Nostoc TaxID=2593658 RepID=UPI00168423C9|nr:MULTISPECIES: PrsW family glutamic-type intramembrane protease [unclassified Nostoc]MBD2451061.1 PrsW family intramembrane metalloprotease [Nostoc sp. FACHB-152]MBD2471099.1 PrsW family intramembrane metalloprotease [Nostoc sp. FACHB-145]
MANLALLLWAVIPPLLFLGYYYRRIAFAPSYLRLLLFFAAGAISGVVALSLELGFETVANSFVGWQLLGRSLFGVALRQLVEIGPIEEGCKLAAVIIPAIYLQRRYQLRASTIFLFTVAVALGFTAEENWIYFYRGTASIFDRSIGTPVHAMFSAPWGYVLGSYFSKNRRTLTLHSLSIPKALLNSVTCHALVNVLSIAWRYPIPLKFLSYGLFPFLLWMFWRLEQLLRTVQGQPPINLISGFTPQHRYWQRGLVIFALIVGGNSIFGWLLLARIISPLRISQLLYPNILQFIFSRFLLNLLFALVAWLIYLYLLNSTYR